MDEPSLRRALDVAAVSEYADAICGRLTELNLIGRRGDNRALLALLKEAGCTKMGVRQRVATLLMCELSSSSSSSLPSTATTLATASSSSACDCDAFWSQMAQDASLTTWFGDLPPPTSAEADRMLLSVPKPPPVAMAVSKLPPDALRCRSAAPPILPVGSTAESGTASQQPLSTRVVAEPAVPSCSPAVPAEREATTPAEEQAGLFRKLGDEAYARRDIPSAERWFVQALASTPRSVLLLSRLADCAGASSPPQPARALKHLNALLELEPDHADARVRAANYCVALGQLDEAISHCDVVLTPEMGMLGTEAPHGTDGGALPNGVVKGPAEVARSAIRQRATDARAEASYAASHAAKSRQCSREGRVLEALQSSRIVRQACAACLFGTQLAVEALEAHGRLDEALDEARDAASRLPDEPSAALLVARLLARKGRVDEAQAELVSVEARARASALASRASSSARQGFDRAASALKSLRIAIQHKAEGNHAYAAGQYERAITCYTAAIGADTEGFLAPLLLGNRSLAHMKLCQLGLARADLDEAIAIDAAAVKLRLRRAACCIELGDFAAAIADYERTLEVDPENATALAGIERAEEAESGGDGRKGGLIEFEDEKLDPYQVLDLPKECNAVQIKARFRQLALQLHPDKHEGADEAEKERIAKEFRRVRIAHAVLSDPDERSRLDEEGYLAKGAAAASPIKPFHEYYSINTPAGYTRGGDFVSTRRYDPMVGALDRLGRMTPAERLSRRQMGALQHEEVIRLKGPEESKLLGFHDSANAPDQYHQYWDRMKERIPASKEESAPSWKKGAQPKLIAQTRYMPLEEEDRDHVQRAQLQQSGIKGPHTET